MGNSSETQSNIFGKFYKESECSCSNYCKKIYRVTFDCCRIMNALFHVASNVVSKIRGFGRALDGKDPQWNAVHAFIKLDYKCSNCNKCGSITVDFGKGYGTRIRFGRYTNTSNFAEYKSKSRSYLNFQEVKNKVNHLKNNGYKSYQYDVYKNNCQDFAKKLYYDL